MCSSVMNTLETSRAFPDSEVTLPEITALWARTGRALSVRANSDAPSVTARRANRDIVHLFPNGLAINRAAPTFPGPTRLKRDADSQILNANVLSRKINLAMARLGHGRPGGGMRPECGGLVAPDGARSDRIPW